MNLLQVLSTITVGLTAGMLRGMFGVGDDVISEPFLILFYGMNQLSAVGTSLITPLLPVGHSGIIGYYNSGNIQLENIWYGILIATGLVAGSFFGARIARHLPTNILQKTFAVF
jgi:uncharacterized protein